MVRKAAVEKKVDEAEKKIPAATDIEVVGQVEKIADLLNTSILMAAKRDIQIGINLTQKETEFGLPYAQVNVLTAHKDMKPKRILRLTK
jgi:hypothetical protein